MPLTDIDQIKFSHLPEDLRVVEQEVGRPTAVKLAALYGGSRQNLPGWGRLKPNHKLVIDFGYEAAVALLKALGSTEKYGLIFDVPIAKEELIFRGIYQYYMLGFSADETCLEVGCHRTQVFRILKLLKGAGIISADPIELLSDDQKNWLTVLFSTEDPPTSPKDISRLARALRVPRISIHTFSKRYKKQGN